MMAAPSSIPKDQVQNLLSDSISVLCKNTLAFHNELCVEGLLGITLDKKDVFLINIKEIIDHTNVGQYVNSTCRECRGLGKIVQQSDLPASESVVGTGVTLEPPAQAVQNSHTVISKTAPAQRQVFHGVVSRRSGALQKSPSVAAEQQLRSTTILLSQAQQPAPLEEHSPESLQSHTFEQQSLRVSGSTPPINIELSGHCSEDEVAATIVKKPRICRTPRAVVQHNSSANIMTSNTGLAQQPVAPAVLARSTGSPQKHIRVKLEPQRESSERTQLATPDPQLGKGYASIFHRDSVGLSTVLDMEGVTIKRPLSYEASQSPKLKQVQQSQVPSPPSVPPAIAFDPGDGDQFTDFNSSAIQANEEFYTLFSGKFDMEGSIVKPVETSSDNMQEAPTLCEIEPGGEVFAQGPSSKASDDPNTSPYLGSIEISPKSSLEGDRGEVLENFKSVAVNRILVPGDCEASGSQMAEPEKSVSGPRKLLPEDVVSAQIVLLDCQPQISPSGQPLPTAHSTLAEGSTVLLDGEKIVRKAPGGKYGLRALLKTGLVKRSESTSRLLPGSESLKVFMCPYCNKAFAHRASLVRHKRIHRGKFCSCSLCGKNFFRRDVLNRHMNAMHKGQMSEHTTSAHEQTIRADDEHSEFVLQSLQHLSEESVHPSEHCDSLLLQTAHTIEVENDGEQSNDVEIIEPDAQAFSAGPE